MLFVEAPDGLYVPLPKKIADDGKGAVTFEVDLSKDVDIAALKGKQLTATIVSDKGQSGSNFPASVSERRRSCNSLFLMQINQNEVSQ